MNPFLSVEVQRNLLLASASPRRREILERLGFEFDILPTDIDEDVVSWDDPEKSVGLLAELKAVDAQSHRPRRTIIAGDTVVMCGGERLGKPSDSGDAEEMLKKLSGREHEVITGLALVAPPNLRIIKSETTKVLFRELSGREIMQYIETREPFDKAGAYAIQGYASVFVEKIEGCYFNVVGLPVSLLFRMFRELESMIR